MQVVWSLRKLLYFCPLFTVFITDKISSFCLQVALQVLHHKLPEFCAYLCNAVIGYLSTRSSSVDGRYGQGLRIIQSWWGCVK